MRAPFGEGAAIFMRKQLKEWLDLSLNRALPSSLLLLSRAFTVTQPLESPTPDTPYDSLKETISSLPNKAGFLPLPLVTLCPGKELATDACARRLGALVGVSVACVGGALLSPAALQRLRLGHRPRRSSRR